MSTVGYARVSSREQSENSHALDQQCDRLKRAGVEKIYIDVQSGSKDNRPQFNQMMKEVRQGNIEEIIITRLDRLTRSLPTLRRIIDELQAHNCKLNALDDNIQTDTAAGKFQLNMLGALAEMETDRLSERVQHGWKYLRESKRVVGVPFGYKNIQGKAELNHDEFLGLIKDQKIMSQAEISREIIDTFLEKKSLRMCLREINERFGIQTFAHNNQRGEKKGGRVAHYMFRFSPGGLKNWLTNPILRGHVCYLRKDRNRTKTYYDIHERIMTEEEFREIQSILSYNAKTKGFGSTALRYPCSGLVYCDQCRSVCYALSGAKNYHKAKRLGIEVERNYYYQCKNWRLRACENKKVIRMEVIENSIITALTERAHSVSKIASSASQSELPQSPQLLKLEQQLQSLQSIPGDNPAIEEAIASVRNQIETLRYLLLEQKQQDISQEILLEIFSNPEFYLGLNEEDKRRIFNQLVDKVFIKDGLITDIRLKV